MAVPANILGLFGIYFGFNDSLKFQRGVEKCGLKVLIWLTIVNRQQDPCPTVLQWFS